MKQINKLVLDNGDYSYEGDSIKTIILYVLLQFPISSMLKVYIGPLNIILTGLSFILFFLYYLKNKLKKSELLLLMYIGITIVQNACIWGFHYYEKNMLFYFPFLILYFCFFVRNTSDIFAFMREHKRYIDIILLIWNFLVVVSLFMSSSYIYEGETRAFVSIAKTTFLLSSVAIFVFALLTFQYYIYRKKIYMFALIIPSLCILLGTTRTYLVVLMCAWLIFLYVTMKNQKKFLSTMIVCGTLFVLIVLISPIKDKFLSTANRASELNMDPLQAFTSGRSVFWVYDMDNILSNNFINILLGNGVNYIFYLNASKFHNPLWAHNDFIQILSDYGIVGILVYLYMFKYLIFGVFKNNEPKVPKKVIVIMIIMWSFNAFFNMFYTYFCAVLSFPFYLLIVKLDIELRNLDKGDDKIKAHV